jgi:flavin-dependent dehydrogenase
VAAKQLTGNALNRDHHVGSVRAYYSNVAGMSPDTIEVYFDKRFLPSYLWVFPLPGNKANVGFGMLSSEISKRKINIRQAFYDFIEQTPVLRQKFANAAQVGELEGFGLPLGSNICTISGDSFMLTGDAASLIDPISGDGIGNAMLSGKYAAEQAIRCFQRNNFSAAFMKEYDKTLLNDLGAELRMRYKAQRTLSRMPFLLDIIFLAGKNRLLKNLIQKGL